MGLYQKYRSGAAGDIATSLQLVHRHGLGVLLHSLARIQGVTVLVIYA